MHHGCYKRCPKVREQQRKARQARAKNDEDETPSSSSSSNEKINDIAGVSGLERRDIRSAPRSKESDRYKSGVSSPRRIKTVEPIKSQDSVVAARSRDRFTKSPTSSKEKKLARDIVSPARSKTSRLDDNYTYARGSPSSSRKFDRVNQRSSQESRLKRQDYPVEQRKHHRDEREKTHLHKQDTRVSREKFHAADHLRSVKRGKHDRPGASTRSQGRRGQDSSVDTMLSDDASIMDDRGICDRHCRGRKERLRIMRNNAEQEDLDDYILNKGLSYFRNLCNCHCACLANQLLKDSFVTSTVASAALFAVGVKLCSELNGWTISNTF